MLPFLPGPTVLPSSIIVSLVQNDSILRDGSCDATGFRGLEIGMTESVSPDRANRTRTAFEIENKTSQHHGASIVRDVAEP